MANAGRIIVTEFAVAVAVVTWDEVVKNGRVPLPSRYIGAGLAFGLLGVLAPVISDKLAATLGAGIILALLFQVLPGSDPQATTPERAPATTQDRTGGIVSPT